MKITLIAAMDHNRMIGKAGGIPWHLPEDFAHFKKTTLGHSMIMGRKTFKSLPGILPGRQHVVISRSKHIIKSPNVIYVDNQYAAINACKTEDIFVIGGGEVYSLFMPLAQEIILTEVHISVPGRGDAYFPEVPLAEWEEISRTLNDSCGLPHSYVTYRRK